MNKTLQGLLLATAVVLAGCTGAENDAAQAALDKQWLGRSLADVTVQTLDGEAQPLKDAILTEGKPVVVNVWATWCTPCLKEMPTLDALGKEGRYKVLAIATDNEPGMVREFLKKQDWGRGTFMLYDRLGAETRAKMGARQIPVTFVTDPSLTIKLVAAGERDWAHASMQAKIVEALAK